MEAVVISYYFVEILFVSSVYMILSIYIYILGMLAYNVYICHNNDILSLLVYLSMYKRMLYIICVSLIYNCFLFCYFDI